MRARNRSAQPTSSEEYISQQEMERARTADQQAEESRRKALAEVAASAERWRPAGGSRKQIGVMQQQLAVLTHQC